jgi:hypothetical protein
MLLLAGTDENSGKSTIFSRMVLGAVNDTVAAHRANGWRTAGGDYRVDDAVASPVTVVIVTCILGCVTVIGGATGSCTSVSSLHHLLEGGFFPWSQCNSSG